MVMTLLKALWDLFNPIKSSYKIIKGKPLSDDHTIVKLVGGSLIKEHNGGIKIDGNAFLSRHRDEGRPSYNWLDFFTGTIEQKLTQLKKTTTLNRGATAKFAELNVGNVRKKVRKYIPSIDIIHDPQSTGKNKDFSHCVMTNIPRKLDENYEPSSAEEAVGRIISRDVTNIYPAG